MRYLLISLDAIAPTTVYVALPLDTMFYVEKIGKSYSLYPCRNLERNQLNGSIPAELVRRSKSGSLLLRYGFCQKQLTL